MGADLLKRAEVLGVIAKTGKLNHRETKMSPANLYKLVKHWEEIGLLTTQKEGRELVVKMTDKGKRYLIYYSSFKEYKDL
jgi:DNA-binding PadR family transcriptional regulator